MTEMRTVAFKGIIYFCQEDIISLLREIAATEETDVRIRLNQLADNIQSAKIVK